MTILKRIFRILGNILFLVLLLLIILIVTAPSKSENITYGVSFSKFHSDELGLDWKEVYDALLNDLGVGRLRLSAHWPMVEPTKDTYNFTELDYQIAQAEEHNAKVVFAVGRRLTHWPECHVPEWAKGLPWEDQKEEIREYVQVVVERYKDSPAIEYWQVENEPYLTVFAFEHCGALDNDFLKEEIALVKSIDNSHPVLVTDSGNLGPWLGAYRNGDVFGTSVYVYLWNPELGQVRTGLPPLSYRVKQNAMRVLFGKKEVILIELGLEPWLTGTIVDTPVAIQYERMGLDKFREIVTYARSVGFEKQYLWGAEWWYWMMTKQNDPQYWDEAKEMFKEYNGLEH